MKKIIAYWRKERKYEVYSSLVGFVEHNPQYNKETITRYITRKGIPYRTEDVIVVTAPYIKRLTRISLPTNTDHL